MFYTVYKITNIVNGKIYIGVHKTDNLNDDYMGSGKLVKAAQEKYGIENFTREYLQVFDNAEDMFKMESELVNEEFVARNDTYNLTLGGHGGWDHINTNENSKEWSAAGTESFVKRFNEDSDFRDDVRGRLKRTSKLAGKLGGISTAEKRRSIYKGGGWTFSGKTHSAETKAKMSEKGKLRTGDKNSQFGTMWIMNSESGESKKIKKDDRIPDGWVKGRKIKNVGK